MTFTRGVCDDSPFEEPVFLIFQNGHCIPDVDMI